MANTRRCVISSRVAWYGITGYLHLTGLHAALPDKRLDHLFLAIARHPRDAEYFTRSNLKRRAFDRRMAAIIVDRYIPHGKAYPRCGSTGLRATRSALTAIHDGGVARLSGAHHQTGERVAAGRRYRARPDLPAFAQHGDVVGIRHHFAELVRDHQHGQLAACRQVAHQTQHLVCLLRRQHGSRFIENQETLPADTAA